MERTNNITLGDIACGLLFGVCIIMLVRFGVGI